MGAGAAAAENATKPSEMNQPVIEIAGAADAEKATQPSEVNQPVIKIAGAAAAEKATKPLEMNQPVIEIAGAAEAEKPAKKSENKPKKSVEKSVKKTVETSMVPNDVIKTGPTIQSQGVDVSTNMTEISLLADPAAKPICVAEEVPPVITADPLVVPTKGATKVTTAIQEASHVSTVETRSSDLTAEASAHVTSLPAATVAGDRETNAVSKTDSLGFTLPGDSATGLVSEIRANNAVSSESAAPLPQSTDQEPAADAPKKKKSKGKRYQRASTSGRITEKDLLAAADVAETKPSHIETNVQRPKSVR